MPRWTRKRPGRTGPTNRSGGGPSGRAAVASPMDVPRPNARMTDCVSTTRERSKRPMQAGARTDRRRSIPCGHAAHPTGCTSRNRFCVASSVTGTFRLPSTAHTDRFGRRAQPSRGNPGSCLPYSFSLPTVSRVRWGALIGPSVLGRRRLFVRPAPDREPPPIPRPQPTSDAPF